MRSFWPLAWLDLNPLLALMCWVIGVHLSFINVSSEFEAPAEFREWHTIHGFPLAYAVMCEFWASTVFGLPEVRSLRYFLRLDADATLSCGPGAPDAFDALKQHSAHYGYFLLGRDEAYVSKGFSKHLHRHLAERLPKHGGVDHGVAGQQRGIGDQTLDIATKLNESTAPMFYTNFEVVDIEFFLST